MTDHDEYLELAAAGLDFELSEEERARLDLHLRGCTSCRQRTTLLAADARAIGGAVPFQLSASSYERIATRLRSSDRPSIGTLRLVLLATLLAIAAVGAAQVGARLVADLSRDDKSLSIERPLASTSPFVSDPSPTGRFAAGTIVDVVAGGLRVRSAPTVDNEKSAKFDALLDTGTKLRVVDGPVVADGYSWYEIEVVGSDERGWVSSGDHDGTPWIGDPRVVSTALTEQERGLMAVVRPDAAVGCEHRSGALPARSVAGIECRLRTATVARVGVYQYPTAADALATYIERMATEGVAPLAGDCAKGTEGDQSWGRPGEDAATSGRIGCFRDANGSANIRLTCGSIGIGALGREGGSAALWAWVWRTDKSGAGATPGICAAS
jgi:hypothetical protein